MDPVFHRPELARQMARQLLHPGVLDEGLRSGLFISGQRRTGKTTFLQGDLVPALLEAGAIVIYVDLWSNTLASPATLVHAAIRKALAELQTAGSALLERLRGVRNLELAAAGFRFEGESTVLKHEADDHSLKVTDPALRGHTDQFIYKFRKPK